VTDLDREYGAVQAGNQEAFSAWVRLVELPLRRSLRPFARVADVESLMQEGLLRMWVLAPRLELKGENASLRYAHRLLRNMAISEARRLCRYEQVADLARAGETDMLADPAGRPDDRLRRIILDCVQRLPERPRQALWARIERGDLTPDRDLAAGLDMRRNTFFQNVARARRLVATCLERNGVSVHEVLR